MNMDINNVNNCLSLDVHPLNLPSAAVKPRKKRTKFLRIGSTSHGPLTPKPRRPDPSAPKITRPCTECGKKFWSWKALFGHMRCHPERQWRGINPPSHYCRPPLPEATSWGNVAEEDDDSISIVTEEDHEVATCLLILANGPNKSLSTGGMPESYVNYVVEGGGGSSSSFECSSCKKVFGSHQALGGHRASHKNVKGCYANTKKQGEEEAAVGGHDEASFGHKCSVCLRVFSSGQALGGHKRCHWEKMEDEIMMAPLSRGYPLDLNFPAAAPLVQDCYDSRLPDLDLRHETATRPF